MCCRLGGSQNWVSDSIAGRLASSICCGHCSEIFVEVQDPQAWQQAESICQLWKECFLMVQMKLGKQQHVCLTEYVLKYLCFVLVI